MRSQLSIVTLEHFRLIALSENGFIKLRIHNVTGFTTCCTTRCLIGRTTGCIVCVNSKHHFNSQQRSFLLLGDDGASDFNGCS